LGGTQLPVPLQFHNSHQQRSLAAILIADDIEAVMSDRRQIQISLIKELCAQHLAI